MDTEKFTTATVTREAKAVLKKHADRFKESLGGKWSYTRTIHQLDKIVESKK